MSCILKTPLKCKLTASHCSDPSDGAGNSWQLMGNSQDIFCTVNLIIYCSLLLPERQRYMILKWGESL